jgi:hypothetical protein
MCHGRGGGEDHISVRHPGLLVRADPRSFFCVGVTDYFSRMLPFIIRRRR